MGELVLADMAFPMSLIDTGNNLRCRSFGDEHEVGKRRIGRLLEALAQVGFDGVVRAFKLFAEGAISAQAWTVQDCSYCRPELTGALIQGQFFKSLSHVIRRSTTGARREDERFRIRDW